jgi:predicted HNH restriction endonuclease
MIENRVDVSIRSTLRDLPPGSFSTLDFIEEYRARYPTQWSKLQSEHGIGGKGAGQHYTVFTNIAHSLSKLAKDGELEKLDYRPAPETWGNRVIQYWTLDSSQSGDPEDEGANDPEYREGSLRLKTHLQRERRWGLAKRKKEKMIKQHGKLFCERCQLDPGEAFGLPIGHAVIEVHHAAVAVGDMKDGHTTKLKDLQCLCANCHRLVHAEIRSSAL